MLRKATQEGSRQTKRAGTSPSMMRVNTVAKRCSSFLAQYNVHAPLGCFRSAQHLRPRLLASRANL